MHPVIFEIPIGGGLKIHSYGLMMALGFLAALWWIRSQGRREGLPVARLTDLTFWMIVWAIIGSRLAFILLEWRQYWAHPLDILKIWEGGLVFLGGLLACLVVAVVYLRRHHLNFWRVSDVFAPGIALGHALGRVGCFLAGCCHGRLCDPHAWYAVTFPATEGALAPSGVALYPTQLMEATTEFLLFLFLALKSQKKGFDGQILLLYLIFYSAFRIINEWFRGDMMGGAVVGRGFNPSSWVSLLLIIFGLIMLLYRKGRSP